MLNSPEKDRAYLRNHSTSRLFSGTNKGYLRGKIMGIIRQEDYNGKLFLVINEGIC